MAPRISWLVLAATLGTADADAATVGDASYLAWTRLTANGLVREDRESGSRTTFIDTPQLVGDAFANSELLLPDDWSVVVDAQTRPGVAPVATSRVHVGRENAVSPSLGGAARSEIRYDVSLRRNGAYTQASYTVPVHFEGVIRGAIQIHDPPINDPNANGVFRAGMSASTTSLLAIQGTQQTAGIYEELRTALNDPSMTLDSSIVSNRRVINWTADFTCTAANDCETVRVFLQTFATAGLQSAVENRSVTAFALADPIITIDAAFADAFSVVVSPNVVPLPASAWLLLGAGGTLAACTRRRRSARVG